MRRILNFLLIFLLVIVSASLIFFEVNPVQEVEINKVSTREVSSKSNKANTTKKPSTPAPAKVGPANKRSVIKINDKCSLINFRLNEGCLKSGGEHAIDLVGQ